MTSERTGQLLRSAPDFPVADVEYSAAHDERVPGFTHEYVADTPPRFAALLARAAASPNTTAP